MQTRKTALTSLTWIAFLILSACNNSSQPAESNKDTSTAKVASEPSPSGPTYDASLDPLVVGAAFAKKIYDTLGLKMYEIALKPGDSLPLHSHPDHAFYLLDSSKALLFSAGKDKPDTLSGAPGIGWVTGPFNDALKNIGKKTLRFLEIDIHRPRGHEMPVNPVYDSTLDAFALGGESVQKIADTLGVGLFIVTIKPGDTATMHSHPDHTMYVLEGGEMAVSFKGGPRMIMKLQKGMGLINGPVSDAAKNTGKTSIKMLMAHVYRPRT